MSGSEPPKKDEPAGADPPPEGAPPAAPAKPRGGRFDDRTMVLTPIAPKQPEGAAPEWKRTLEEPTMKHVATSPRPARTKFDDETMRAIAPVKAEPRAVKPPADETMRVVAPAVRPSVPPSAPATAPQTAKPLIDPTLEMAPGPLPPLEAPASPPAAPVTRPVARFDPTMTSGLAPITAFAPPPPPRLKPEPTRTSFLEPVTFPSQATPPPDTRRGTVEEIAAALARRHPLPEPRARTLETGAPPDPMPPEPASLVAARESEDRGAPTVADVLVPPPSVGAPPTAVPLTRPRRGIGDVLPVVHATRFAPFVMHWQLRPPKHAIVVTIKATARIGSDGAIDLLDAEAPSGDVFAAKEETAPLRYPSDFAVFKPRADVMLLADGHAPGREGTVGRVQFRFGTHAWELAVIGDRHWDGSTPSRPAPFTAMPLDWERALGGPLSTDNPVGRGFKTGTLLPNLERPRELIVGKRDTPRPVCFAPVSPRWRSRASKRGRYDGAWLERRWPYLPEDFEFEYFNAAPVEQQIPYPRGDERFEVTGVKAGGAVLEGRLPGIRPSVFAQKSDVAGGEFLALHMNLDTVLIDARRSVVTLVWRGMLEVSDRDALDLDLLYVEEGTVAAEPQLEAARTRWLAQSSRPSPSVAQTEPANDESAAPSTTVDIADAKRGRRPLPSAPDSPPAATHKQPKAPVMPRETVLQWIADGRSLKSLDLSGVDLRGVDLRGKDLQGAIMTGALLDGAKLDEANCAGMIGSGLAAEGSSWTGADLTKADLSNANVSRADFSETNLTQFVAEHLRASGAKFDRTRGPGARLAGSELDDATFAGARLAKADFSAASLHRAGFQKARLPDAKFYEAVGDGMVLDDAELTDLRCEGAKLRGLSAARVSARGSVWDRSDVTDGTFEAAVLEDASFIAAITTRTIFNKAVATRATFRGASLREAKFLKADLTKASFEQADLTHADLRGATLDEAETWEARLEGADLRQASVLGSKLQSGKGS